MRAALALPLIAMVVSSCDDSMSVSPQVDETIARQCLQQTEAPGSYSFRVSDSRSSYMRGLPMARPVENLGGTIEGADLINSCILTKASSGQYSVESTPQQGTKTVNYTYGTPPAKPAVDTSNARARIEAEIAPKRQYGQAACRSGASVLYGGSLYCIR